jgi:hypothetical protein
MQANDVLNMCNCKTCIFDREMRGKNESIILGRALISLLITSESINEYNRLHHQIYKTPEFKEVLTIDNLNENRKNPLLIRMLRQKQLLNNGCPESFISFAKVPEAYLRYQCYKIITNAKGHEIIYYTPKDHLKTLVFEMSRWMNAGCFPVYPYIAFVNTIKMISNINVYVQPDEHHSDWLIELNKISFITKNRLSIEESRQFVNIIYTKVYEMYMSMAD